MFNLANRKCTSPPLLAPSLKIFRMKTLLPRRGSNPGPAGPEAYMLPSEPTRRAVGLIKTLILRFINKFSYIGSASEIDIISNSKYYITYCLVHLF